MKYPPSADLPQEPATGAWSTRLPWGESDDNATLGSEAAFDSHASGAAGEAEPALGHIGRYTLKYRISESGFGTVYAAQDPVLSRLIAIKTLQPELESREQAVFNNTFLSEARGAASLSHPYIVTVFDAGISEKGAYIAMELLRGRDLQQLIREDWRPSPTQAATIAQRVADALAYAHSHGVVHRDIKPANIFMVGLTQPRVLDFGISSGAFAHDALIPEQQFGGSLYCMAPEQALQKLLDGRCDVFALGVVLYELLTGVRPFVGDNLDELVRAVLEHQPPPAHQLNPGVPKTLSEIAARAMEKAPEARLPSASVMSRELKRWLESSEARPEREATRRGAKPLAWLRKHWVQGAAVAGLAVLALIVWVQFSPSQVKSSLADWVETGSRVRVGVVTSTPVVKPEPVLSVPVGPPPAAAPAAAPNPKHRSRVAAPRVPRATAAPVRAPSPPITPRASRAAPETEGVSHEIPGSVTAPPVVVGNGSILIAVSPWGQVEVDGADRGIAPPLSELTLSEGRHIVTLRNGDFPPYSVTVKVTAGRSISVKHKFGS